MAKTILITGSTDGIGKQTALKLAKAGHIVYLHGRNQEKLSRSIAHIITESGNENVKGVIADFSNLNSVREMAVQVKEALPVLDVLLNNAGIFNSPERVNKAGIDMRIMVNYLAPYVLTDALIPLLQQSTAPRIINVSSAAQSSVSLAFLKGREARSAGEAYAQSKLALIQWSFKLAEIYPGIEVIAINPGSLLNTKLVKEAFGHHWSSIDKGADILADLTISEKRPGMTGRYFDNDKGDFGRAHSDAYDKDRIENLIQTTHALLAREN